MKRKKVVGARRVGAAPLVLLVLLVVLALLLVGYWYFVVRRPLEMPPPGDPAATEETRQEQAQAPGVGLVINEIAWMGGKGGHSGEWIEIFNDAATPQDLANWVLAAEDGTPTLALHGVIPAHGLLVLSRAPAAIPGVAAQLTYTGALENAGEKLELIAPDGRVVDSVSKWYAGDNTTGATMARREAARPGNDPDNWENSTLAYANGLGTPGRPNGDQTPPAGPAGEDGPVQAGTPPQWEQDDCVERLHQVDEEPGAVNVYFNKSALTEYARPPDNRANYNINLEWRLIRRLKEAEESIELATYELNLEGIVATLILQASRGVMVRVIEDAKIPSDEHYRERFVLARLELERLARGLDGRPGSADDVAVFSESPIFAVEDPGARRLAKLPPVPDDFPRVTYRVARDDVTGYLIAEGEARDRGGPGYYSPRTQMHNKFAIVDGRWVFTGSWNFTMTGLYGDEASKARGCMNGNQQHVVEIHDDALATEYLKEFNEMWGGPGRVPSPAASNFNTRKSDNTRHELMIGGRRVEVYFSPSDHAVDKIAERIREGADRQVLFTIFAWSDQAITDALKAKWEGSAVDNVGQLTGFEIRGVFDRSFGNNWWSASVDMTGRTASDVSDLNPNTRWRNKAPVLMARETRKLHAKTMVIDPDFPGSDPMVIVGAANWSQNANAKNDENLLVIHDAGIANQFLQEIYARYRRAGGDLPPPPAAATTVARGGR